MKINFSLIIVGIALSAVFTTCKDHNPSGSSDSDSTKPFMQPASDSAVPGNAAGSNTDTSAGKTTTGKDTANKKY